MLPLVAVAAVVPLRDTVWLVGAAEEDEEEEEGPLVEPPCPRSSDARTLPAVGLSALAESSLEPPDRRDPVDGAGASDLSDRRWRTVLGADDEEDEDAATEEEDGAVDRPAVVVEARVEPPSVADRPAVRLLREDRLSVVLSSRREPRPTSRLRDLSRVARPLDRAWP